MAPPIHLCTGLSEQDFVWFDAMVRDGYLSAIVRTNEKNFPTVFMDVKVELAGKDLVKEHESKTTFRGIWKKHHLAIFTFLLGIASTVFVQWLLKLYELK